MHRCMKFPLRHLALFVTESCNLACEYCYAAGREGRHIDPSLAQAALEYALGPGNASPSVTITFWGGEPLLQFDAIVRLVRSAETLARDHGKSVHFVLPTNVTLLEEAHIAFFLDHRVGISLSLDGGERAQALRPTARGASSFPIILDKLELIARRYGKYLPPVRMTVSPATVADFVKNVRFFLDRGFDRIYFAPVVEAIWTPEALDLLEAGQIALLDVWVDLLRQGRRLGFHTWDRALTALRLQRLGARPADPPVPCGAGTSMLAVDIYGNFYPCHRFVFYDKPAQTMALGTVSEGGPDPEKQALYASLKRSDFASSSTTCAACALAPRCQEMCPAINYALQGDVTRVDQRLCRLAEIEARIVDRIDRLASRVPELEAYVEALEARAMARIRGAEPLHWYHRADEADVDALASRAAQVLSRLRGSHTRRLEGHDG